ncbi:hypothetical protein ACIOD2_00430 [Amycolatopsis sp. NPDC088138]|uniref:hypothetical protein n=1 Tax=Amycolatopsis sp. NPDC088138 TaxID=3363938 RepID=UPI00381B796D
MANRADNAYTALVRHVVADGARTARAAVLILVVTVAVAGVVATVALTAGGLGATCLGGVTLAGAALRAFRRR